MQPFTFNSLYGILSEYVNISIPKDVYFQFPLWDTIYAFKLLYQKEFNFQFPLWDTEVVGNMPPATQAALSIPFMGYAGLLGT